MVMAIAFVIAPMTAAADIMHPGDQAAEECSASELAQDVSDKEPSHEGHDHTAHQCGSCHFHLIGGGDLSGAPKSVVQTKHLVPGGSFLENLRPDGLYRPPRA